VKMVVLIVLLIALPIALPSNGLRVGLLGHGWR